MREQTLAVLSVLTIGVGVAVTGFFPTAFGFYATTVLKSLGFHYYETAAQSLALQWFDKAVAPSRLGRISAIASVATIVAYGLIFLTWKWFALDFVWVFLASGTVAAAIGLAVWLTFPYFAGGTAQHKHLVIRRRYLGDIVLLGPVFRNLRLHWPGAHLAAVAEPAQASFGPSPVEAALAAYGADPSVRFAEPSDVNCDNTP